MAWWSKSQIPFQPSPPSTFDLSFLYPPVIGNSSKFPNWTLSLFHFQAFAHIAPFAEHCIWVPQIHPWGLCLDNACSRQVCVPFGYLPVSWITSFMKLRQWSTWLICICYCCLVASVVSDSVRPQRRQPTRLPHPWDSPGKNTGVGCHFLPQCMKVKSEREVTQLCPTLHEPVDCSLPGSTIHGIFQARVLEWGAIAF